MGRRPGISGGLPDAGDVQRNFIGAESGLLNIARDLLRRRALFLDGAGDRGCDLAHLIDGGGDPLDRLDSLAGRGLDRRDLGTDLIGRLGGLLGEILDLGCHHGESLAGFAGASGLDGCIEGEKVGLAGDFRDNLDHITDARRFAGQALDRRICAV